MHILYLEDNPQDAKLVERYVATTPHTLAVVNHIEAARAIDITTLDLVLVDILIGNRRDGLDFVRHLRASGFAKPIVAVTAVTMEADIINCKNAGCNTVLIKPYTILQLAALIDEILV